jgi:hypothetical protein
MNTKQWLSAQTLTLPLIALMALTRSHHIGDAFSLPDASLAVFFLAGLVFARRWWLFGFLMLEAVLIDYIAITHFNVSAFCVSPAYVFLIPAYAVMWFAGSFCEKFKSLTASEMLSSMGVMLLATSTSFFISSGSFYFLSGRYPDSSWVQFIERVVKYYPAHTTTALCYGLFGLLVIKLVKALPALLAHKAV